MSTSLLALAAEMEDRLEPFVMATVVWRRGPTSGKEGARALIRADGSVLGWLGGACAEPTLVSEALSALQDGTSRLMLLGPVSDREGRMRDGVVSVPMACESEGAMEVHLEPVVPKPHLVAIGRSPAVGALVAMAGALGWHSTAVDFGRDGAAFRSLHIGPRTFVVVASQGHYDEPALEAALETGAGYVGLVASQKRASAVLEYLRGRGVGDEALARVHAPAGLDLGRVEHEEMAVAIMAELVALKAAGGIVPGVAVAEIAEAIDPVCGMTVAVAGAVHTVEHGGETVYFCAAGCKQRFVADPARF